MYLSLSLQVVLDNKDRHSGTTLASSDFAGEIFLPEASHWEKWNYKYLPRSTKPPQVTDGTTWNLAGCLGGAQLVAHLIRQAMERTIFPFEIRNNYSPSSGLVEYLKLVCSLSWQTGMKKIFKCRALHSPWAIEYTNVIFFLARSSQKL